jgi:DNA-binding transcriptional LysR family regulator
MNISPAAATFDWSLMRSFLAVIERGSLLAAARQLGVSQPTLGRHVTELERQLGTLLFERTGRGLVATSAARSIADRARAMADNAEAIGRTLTGQSKQLTGSVRVTASQTVATYLLPPLLARFHERETGIAIDMTSSNAVSNLLRREADIAVRMARPAQSSLVARRVGEVRIGAYARKDYLRRRGVPGKAADLPHFDLIGLDRDPSMIRAFAALGHRIERDSFTFRSDDHLVLGAPFAPGWGSDLRRPGSPIASPRSSVFCPISPWRGCRYGSPCTARFDPARGFVRCTTFWRRGFQRRLTRNWKRTGRQSSHEAVQTRLGCSGDRGRGGIALLRLFRGFVARRHCRKW